MKVGNKKLMIADRNQKNMTKHSTLYEEEYFYWFKPARAVFCTGFIGDEA
jgi:hypothetical protein